jgi:hypothetical protein
MTVKGLRRRSEPESLPQRHRGAEIGAEKGEELSIAEIAETLISLSGWKATRAALRLCVSSVTRTAADVSRPDHETRKRVEAESLPQRRRGAEKLVSRCTIIRAVHFKHGVSPTTKPVSLSSLRSNPPCLSLCLSLRLCVSAVKRTADGVSRPEHETKPRAEAESLPQRRRDAEKLVSRCTIIRAVRVRPTTKPVSLLSLRSNALRLSLRLSLRLCVSAVKETADLALVPA